MRNESWPFRRSDALFVVVVVLIALPAQGTDWGIGMPLGLKVTLVIVAVAAWIRFRIFGRSDQETR